MNNRNTVFIIKPDAVKKAIVGRVLFAAEEQGLAVVDMKMGALPPEVWAGFYSEHKGRSFFDQLVEFMCSGPVVCGVFEGDDAIVTWRRCLGRTNPQHARAGSLRRVYGTAGPANVGHGSDSFTSAIREARVLGLMHLG